MKLWSPAWTGSNQEEKLFLFCQSWGLLCHFNTIAPRPINAPNINPNPTPFRIAFLVPVSSSIGPTSTASPLDIKEASTTMSLKYGTANSSSMDDRSKPEIAFLPLR
uniref:Uncharacterized protein n=1 Tax=Salix viminalis TaxID=40686 RepID=A0A6N2L584_SALVM